MSRFRHTIALALTTVAISATAALAAPGDPGATLPDGTSTMAAEMHDTCTMAAGMHETSTMASMHVADHDHHADHASMAGVPEMATHMERFDLDHEEVMGWMADGVEPAEMHARLEARGVDLDELLRTCPHGAAMAPSTMHGSETIGMPGAHANGTRPEHDAHHGS